MYREIDAEEARGKTFQALIFGYEADAVLAFEDGTFFYLKADEDCGDFDLDEATFNTKQFPLQRLIEHGICTREEAEERERFAREAYEKEEKERRRRYFEELKKEFLAD